MARWQPSAREVGPSLPREGSTQQMQAPCGNQVHLRRSSRHQARRPCGVGAWGDDTPRAETVVLTTRERPWAASAADRGAAGGNQGDLSDARGYLSDARGDLTSGSRGCGRRSRGLWEADGWCLVRCRSGLCGAWGHLSDARGDLSSAWMGCARRPGGSQRRARLPQQRIEGLREAIRGSMGGGWMVSGTLGDGLCAVHGGISAMRATTSGDARDDLSDVRRDLSSESRDCGRRSGGLWEADGWYPGRCRWGLCGTWAELSHARGDLSDARDDLSDVRRDLSDARNHLRGCRTIGQERRRAGGVVAECVEGWRIAISAVSPGQYRKAGGLSGGFGGGGRHQERPATARKSARPAWHRSCLMVGRRCECA